MKAERDRGRCSLEVALLGLVAHGVFAFWLAIGPGLWSAVAIGSDAGVSKRS